MNGAFSAWNRAGWPFRNRRDAGRQLGEMLEEYRARRPIVVGLARGGVPVAFEVARALHAPLDVVLVRKLGVPFHPELGMGAIAEGRVRVLTPSVLRAAGISEAEVQRVERRELAELIRRAQRYRAGAEPLDLDGRTVIVVDDGLATGATARAAIASVRRRGAATVVLAVPVGARDTIDALASEVDDLVCVEEPEEFSAVGAWYDDFTPTTDAEVLALLQAGREPADGVDTGRADGRHAS